MKIDLSKVTYNENDQLIDEIITFNEEDYKDMEIRSLSEVKVNGSIVRNTNGTFNLKLKVTGEMILPCSITLVDVKHPFDIEIDEIIDFNSEECDDYLKIIDNTIDIMPIIWQNIVVEIPLKVVRPDLDNIKLEGDGWKLLNEEEKMKELDPRLAKLKDLLDD